MKNNVARLLDEAAIFLTGVSGGGPGGIRDSEQKEVFVASLVITILVEMIGEIGLGKVPEDWNGYELRRWIADVAERQTIEMDRRRTIKYNNDIAIHNL